MDILGVLDIYHFHTFSALENIHACSHYLSISGIE